MGIPAWSVRSQAGVLSLFGDLMYKIRVTVGQGTLAPNCCLMAPSVISGLGLTRDPLLAQRLLGKLCSPVPLRKY